MKVSDIVGYHYKFISMAIYLGASPDEAQDIVQELFLRLLQIENKEGNINRITFNGKLNMGYIYTAIRNRFYLLVKSKNKYSEDAPVPDKVLNEPSFSEMDIHNALSGMHHYYSKLFLAYVFDRHSIRSLAISTGISPSTIFTDLRYVKNSLKRYLNDQNTKPDPKRNQSLAKNKKRNKAIGSS